MSKWMEFKYYVYLEHPFFELEEKVRFEEDGEMILSEGWLTSNDFYRLQLDEDTRYMKILKKMFITYEEYERNEEVRLRNAKK